MVLREHLASDKNNYIDKQGNIYSDSFSEVGPTDALIGYWPMDGHARDLSGNMNHGTVTSPSADLMLNYTAPRDRGCYDFTNYNNDKINLDSIVECNDGAEWSWSFWGYKISYGDDGIAGNQDDHTITSPSGAISFKSPAQLAIYTTTASNEAVNLTDSCPVNKWFNFVITHTSNNVFQFYLDAVHVGEVVLAGDIDVNRIGDNPDSSALTAFNGLMFDFRIYNKKLV
ncbi:MAG: LamG-like jellyroll fold domain-containing protein [Candidatus Asgardarchaeia archaeon]